MTYRFLLLSSVLALGACSGTGGPNDNRKTRTGAIIGGLVGGIAGAIDSDDDDGTELRGALVGAAAGAAIGGGIGQYLDRQQADLESRLGNSGVKIQNTGSELIVTMPQDILFAVDSATLRGDIEADIASLAQSLLEYPNSTVDIIGHTDNTGEASYNQQLSTRRAAAVTSILIRNGVPSNRIRSFGRGENEPVASNLTEEGRRQNRRVEVVIRPNA